jgi:hypothetical protein
MAHTELYDIRSTPQLVSLVSVVLRILLICEERLVKQKYPEYVEYARVTKRMVPYVF